jgi:uncharacterized membrane protein
MLEARRYRYFNVWRARARWIETHFYAPLLNGDALNAGTGWTGTLAEDYLHPRYHVSFMTSVGRRIRRNYLWILLIQTLAYAGKLAVHPFPVESVEQALRRADVGPVPGEVMVGLGGAYILGFAAIALWSYHADARRARERGATGAASMG